MAYDFSSFPLDDVQWYHKNTPVAPCEPCEPEKPDSHAAADKWHAYADALDLYAKHKREYDDLYVVYLRYCNAFLDAYRVAVRIRYGSALTLWSIDFESIWDAQHEGFDAYDATEMNATRYIHRTFMYDEVYINWLKGLYKATAVSGMQAIKDRVNAIVGILAELRSNITAARIIESLHQDHHGFKLIASAYSAYDYDERNTMLNTIIAAAACSCLSSDITVERSIDLLLECGYAVKRDAVYAGVVYSHSSICECSEESLSVADIKIAQIVFCLLYGRMTSDRFKCMGLTDLNTKQLNFILSNRTALLKKKVPCDLFTNLEKLIKKQIKSLEKKD